jgi:hypothetical protein
VPGLCGLPRPCSAKAVAAIVADCTDAWIEPKPPWRARKEAYLAALAHKPEVSLLVSLADKTHNAEAILFDYRVLRNDLWNRFNGGADGTRWYYGAFDNVFASVMPGRLALSSWPGRCRLAPTSISAHAERWPPDILRYS